MAKNRHRGSSRRIWTGAALILAMQLLLIFWLSDSGQPPARATAISPSLQPVPDGFVHGLAVTDPTLFALPSAHGFSGLSWLKIPERSVPAFDWTEPPRYLARAENSGGFLTEFLETNNLGPFFLTPKMESLPLFPAAPPAAQESERSTLFVAGPLAQRRMLSHPELPSWPRSDHTDFLTNSVVHILVDSHGVPVTAALLRPGSGNGDADQAALTIARQARFEPEGNHLDLAWGDLIFEWHVGP
ncbi:MAG: hypothetical protein C5B50_17795 [Verrucomicrobia bacterium]|nr:MAG: hypothetical protein C5B50_17795 [Verrucomicrobiota bacterium]